MPLRGPTEAPLSDISLAAYAVSAFVTLFVTVGPFETAAVFGSLTRSLSQPARLRIARRAIVIAGVVLAGFAAGGGWLLDVLHVSLPAMRTAGGVLLFIEAVSLVFSHAHMSSITESEQDEARAPRDISVFPLAFPLIAGPGSLLAVLLLMSQAAGRPVHVAVLLLIVAATLAITFACYAAVDRVNRVLGTTGVDVMGRLSGLLLAAMAMQFIFDGVREGLFR